MLVLDYGERIWFCGMRISNRGGEKVTEIAASPNQNASWEPVEKTTFWSLIRENCTMSVRIRPRGRGVDTNP